MPFYEYECEEHGVIEIEHSINEKKTKCPQCKKEKKKSKGFKRLISGGTSFILQGGGWASEGYK